MRFIVGDEHHLAHHPTYMPVPFFHVAKQGTSNPCSLDLRVDQDVLQVADRRIVGNRPDQANQLIVLLPRGNDES